MIGMVIVSHSAKLAEGTVELIMQMGVNNVPAVAAGGTKDGRIGTDAEKIEHAINDVFSEDGVLVFYDIGSSLMSAEVAIESLSGMRKNKVQIVHAPLVEGAFIAAVDISIGKKIGDIKCELESIKSNKSEW